MMQTETRDVLIEASKGTPAVAGAIASTVTMNEWIVLATFFYIIVQVLYLIRKWWREEIDRDYERKRKKVVDARTDTAWAESRHHGEDRL